MIRTLAVVASLVAGCSVVAPGSGRDGMARTVRERTGLELASATEGDEPLVADRVRELLSGDLDAEKAVRIALLHNRELRSLYAALDVAESDLVQASLLHNPVIDAALGIPIGGGVVDLSFGVAMDVIDLLYVPLRRRVATSLLEEAKLRIAGEVLDFAWRTQTAALRHQASEQMLALRRHVAAATTVSAELVTRMREAGNVTDLALASETALAEEAKLHVRLAEIAVRESREELNEWMGLWGDEASAWTMAARLPDVPAEPFDLARLESRAIERSLDLAGSEALVVAAGENVGLDRTSALFPEIVVGGAAARDGGTWKAGPSLSLALPFFDWGQARNARAEAELRRAREMHHALGVRIRAAARSARDRMLGHAERALHYRTVELPLRERVVRETQLQYNGMQVGPIELLRAKEQQIESGVDLVEALRDYWLARADVVMLLAGRTPPREPAAPPPAFEQLPRFPFPTL